MIFVQREGTTGTVKFSGLEARVLNSAGDVVVGWTSGGTISGIPQGDGYTLQVNTGSNVTSTALAVGAVVFVMGQSNIQRWFDTPPGGVSTPGIYNMEWDGKIATPVTGGAAQHFTQGYQAALGVPVMIVEGARGGTALLPEADKGNGHWLSTASGSLYANVLARLQQVGGRAELVLWGQGETDASANVTVPAYAAGLTTFMERVLADFKPDRVLIQEIGPHGNEPDKYDNVRAAQYQVADAMALVEIGARTFDTNTIEDGVHLSGASRTLAADRMLIEALKLEGINISRAVQEGAVATDDTLTGGDGRDELRGLSGNDVLAGGAESDVLLGGWGNDTITGGDGLDIIRGDGDDDRIDAGAGNDVVSGGDGADSILGGAGRDEIWADAGGDTIEGGAGNDLIFGGAGTDFAIFSGPRSGYSVVSSSGAIRVTDIDLSNGDDGADTLYGIENLVFSDGSGTPGGGPTLPALFTDMDDYRDFNLLSPGIFNPASYYATLGGNDEVTLPGSSTVAGAIGYDTKQAFDAGAGDDTIFGGALAETIRGGSGDDLLNGGAGGDRMEGGQDNDQYYVDNTKDIVTEREGEGVDIVYSLVNFVLGSHVENLVLQGTSNRTGTGNDLGNSILGNSGSNRLFGMGGDDTLEGGAGADSLDGGLGADSLAGGAGNDRYFLDNALDVILELAGEGTDEVQTTASFTLGANLERLVLLGTSNIGGTGNELDNRLTGNAGNNLLAGEDGRDSMFGGAGDDTLQGGKGNDTLDGGAGVDLLEGGDGNDRYTFGSLQDIGQGGAYDTIMGYSRGDRIDLSRVDAIEGTSSNETFAFRTPAQGITGAGQVTFLQDTATGDTLVLGHVNADGVADFTIVIKGLVSLSSSDFVL